MPITNKKNIYPTQGKKLCSLYGYFAIVRYKRRKVDFRNHYLGTYIVRAVTSNIITIYEAYFVLGSNLETWSFLLRDLER